MDLIQSLHARANAACELCASTQDLAPHLVAPKTTTTVEHHVLLCSSCTLQLTGKNEVDTNHWRCLNSSMWSEVPAVQVLAWRMLTRLQRESWAERALSMLYLDDKTMMWAKEGESSTKQEEIILRHKDSNGTILATGDTVVLIKDLDVKGGGFTAKRGTAVKNIVLSPDNADHIEGRVNGQHIVILTQFVKKS